MTSVLLFSFSKIYPHSVPMSSRVYQFLECCSFYFKEFESTALSLEFKNVQVWPIRCHSASSTCLYITFIQIAYWLHFVLKDLTFLDSAENIVSSNWCLISFQLQPLNERISWRTISNVTHRLIWYMNT